MERVKKDSGLVFHGDRGCQYSSRRYQAMLSENGIKGSMSKAGCPYDNSCTESFFASLKKKWFYRREFDTIDDLRKDLFQYIEIFCNRKRLHSSLGYMSPVSYRLKNQGGTAA
ncbi:MAG: IS3 family transposase [Lachnospiraceae bacterium]|nr:IS3 family transposase [Lachnospiraceae bacterium]